MCSHSASLKSNNCPKCRTKAREAIQGVASIRRNRIGGIAAIAWCLKEGKVRLPGAYPVKAEVQQ